MLRGRKARTPAQLAVLAQAREKAKIVIAERAKLNALANKEDSEPVPPEPEPVPPEPEPLSEDATPELAQPKEDSASESDPRLTRREVGERPSPKYHFVHGVGYIKIK